MLIQVIFLSNTRSSLKVVDLALILPLDLKLITPEAPIRNTPGLLLHNHLSNALPAQSFACDEVLVLEASYAVAGCRQQHDNACSNQAAGSVNDAEDLEDAHGGVHASSHVVGGDLSDDGVKFGRCRTYSEEERNFDKDKDEGAASVESVSCSATVCAGLTARQYSIG